MNVLIKKATIVAPGKQLNGKVMDVLIEGGVIKSIKQKITPEKNVKEIDIDNLHISAGWFDMQVNFCDPGFEHKESLESGLKAAMAGGFTGVAVVPSTNPSIHTKAQVEYIKNKSKNQLVDVFPLGALSYNLEGKDLSEMYDMHLSGAVAFTDDKKAVADSGLLLRALLYAKNFDGKILAYCDEKGLSCGGQINEGEMSVKLGFKGIPTLAEELMVSRNIALAEYTDAAIHLSNVSTAKSAELIKQAKAKGIKVTASAAIYSLTIDETVLKEFDTNYKLNPPLRTKKDCEALQKALSDGIIDVLTSDHRPQDIESKEVEFDHASNGMISLETAYALINSSKNKFSQEQMIESITTNPRKVLGIAPVEIAEGQEANITLFNPEQEWTMESRHIQSKSKNTPFVGKKFKGRVVGVINNNQLQLNK
jgi:dihydroorotase